MVVEMTIYFFKQSNSEKSLFAAFSDKNLIREFMEKMGFDLYREIGKSQKDLGEY